MEINGGKIHILRDSYRNIYTLCIKCNIFLLSTFEMLPTHTHHLNYSTNKEIENKVGENNKYVGLGKWYYASELTESKEQRVL